MEQLNICETMPLKALSKSRASWSMRILSSSTITKAGSCSVKWTWLYWGSSSHLMKFFSNRSYWTWTSNSLPPELVETFSWEVKSSLIEDLALLTFLISSKNWLSYCFLKFSSISCMEAEIRKNCCLIAISLAFSWHWIFWVSFLAKI